MWLALIKLIGGPVVAGLIEAYKAKLAAGTNDKKIAADLAASEIVAQQNDVTTAAEIVEKEQDRWWTSMIRPLMAAPFVIFTWKVVVIDKVLQWGTTPRLDPNLWSVFLTIVAAYYGGRSIEKVARILKG
jgi:hypothetical protein